MRQRPGRLPGAAHARLQAHAEAAAREGSGDRVQVGLVRAAVFGVRSASHHTLVHRWVEGEKVPEEPVPAAYAFEIGEILARIHSLDVAWTGVVSEDPAPRDWPELAERATATGQPWAGELAAQAGTFLEIAHFVDTCERPGPVVLTHRDIQPWNLLARDGRSGALW